MKNIVRRLQVKKGNTPFFKRLIAYFIDWYIISILTIFPINLLYSLTFQEKNFASSLTKLPLPQAICAFGIGLGLTILYLVYYPSKHNGQTLGKKVFRLQIVKDNHESLDFKTLLIRNGLGILLIEGTFYSCSIYFWEVINLASHSSISTIALTILGAISITSIGLSLFSANHRMLHDYISKTSVVVIPK